MSTTNRYQWSKAARSYVQTNAAQEGGNPITETLFAQMDSANPISQASVILDVGSGPGNCMARMIAMFGPLIPSDARLIASDWSDGMIEQVCERRGREQGTNAIWQRVEAKVLDAQELEGIEDDSVSHITGTHVFNLLYDSRKAFQAADRVLQPDGVVGMTLLAVAEWMELIALAAKKIRGDSAPNFELPVTFSTVDGIREEFKRVGWESVYVEEVISNMDVTDSSKLINNFIRGGNPGALKFVGGYSEEELDQFVEEWLRLMRERCPTEPRLLRGVSIVAVGQKKRKL